MAQLLKLKFADRFALAAARIAQGPLTTVDLSEAVGWTTAQSYMLLRSLCDDGLAVRCGEIRTGLGHRPRSLWMAAPGATIPLTWRNTRRMEKRRVEATALAAAGKCITCRLTNRSRTNKVCRECRRAKRIRMQQRRLEAKIALQAA